MSDAGRPSAVLRKERAQRAVARLTAEVGAWLKGWSASSEQTSQITLMVASASVASAARPMPT